MANLGVIDADPSEPPSDDEVIKLANRLLSEFNIPTKIEEVGDVCAALFVLLYENLFSDRLSDIIRQPVSKEDEIHNCQTVIDVLSADIVRDSLSHIRGVDIVNGDITAISNLLDIFSFLLDYVANKIESDIATDNEDVKSLTNADLDSDASLNGLGIRSNTQHFTSHSRDDRSDQKKSISHRDLNGKKERKSPTYDTNDNRCADVSDDKYSALSKPRVESLPGRDDLYLLLPPSPIRPDQSQSLLGQKTVDSTELESQYGKEDRLSPVFKVDRRHELKTDDLDSAIGGIVSSSTTTAAFPPRVTDSTAAMTTHPYDFGADSKPRDSRVPYLSASMPHPKVSSREEEKDVPFRSTVGPIDYSLRHTETRKIQSDRTPEDRDPLKGLSSSYNDLRHLVERTAAMTRVAIQTSPIMGRAQRDLDLGDDTDLPRPTISSDSTRLARELNAKEMRRKETSQPEITPCDMPSRSSKKVAFSSYADAHSPPRSRRHPLEELSENHSRSLSDRKHGYDDGSDSVSNEEVCGGKGYKSRHKSSPDRQRHQKKPQSRTEAYAKHLARSRQPELGAAHMSLKTEDRAIKKKQEFLQRMYQEDLGEYTDDILDIISKANKTSEDMEKEMLKCYRESKPVIKKTKSTVSKKPRQGNRVVSTRAKKESPVGHRKPTASGSSIKVEDQENLLSFLIEEFPHLQLSDHTWHELCRKGLNQIETITRVYKENQRKKSRAQIQLEEAAKRQELLSEIMKKEVNHTKRLREIKENKVQQTILKNKTHERRSQSARARCYYNEYQVRARSKQLKRSTREEMVFRDLFRDALQIQKERIKDIRQYASDQRKSQAIRRQNEMESLENFYQGQFQMLAEKLAQERKDSGLRDKAQHQMVERIKRELRKKIESEIKLYQEQMFRDDDDAHFRQMDADRVKRELHMARYTAHI